VFINNSFTINEEPLVLQDDKAKKDNLRQIMWEKVSIVRTTAGLLEAKSAIEVMQGKEIGRLLRLRLLTAQAIVDSALARKESVGVHYIS
jgi:L-aspartate oxidase